MKKFIICSLLIVLALCQEQSSKTTRIQSFVEGVAQTLNITVGKEISNCFEDNQVDIFFDILQTTSHYTQAIRDGKFNGVMVVATRLWFESLKIVKSLKCVGETKDYKSITKALGIKETDPCEIDKMALLFMDAYPSYVSPFLDNMSSHICRNSFEEAGVVLGKGLIEINKREYCEKKMKVTAFINGFFLRNGLSIPETMRSHCIDNAESDDVIHILRFYKQWAKNMKETKRDEVIRETMRYFVNGGLKHYGESEEIFRCFRESHDNERFRRETGYNFDPYDAPFDFDFGHFLACPKNVRKYVKHMKNIRKVLEKENKFYLCAGIQFGSLVKEISESGIN